MTAVPVAQRMTAEEFLAMPEPELGWPRSLVAGEVVVNDPTVLHGEVQGELYLALTTWSRSASGRGKVVLPIDVQLDERNVFKPDILWYAEGRAPARLDRRPYPMPDLAVEVRSPSTWRYDVGAKKSGYERHGLPELWLVDTAGEAVLVFRRSEPGAPSFDVSLELAREEQVRSPLLPGFGLALAELFPH
jgi:Uma2 family endonuclease